MRKAYIVLILAVVAAGCGGDNPTTPETQKRSSAPAWVWQNPLPHGNDHIGVESLGGGRAIALTPFDVHATDDTGAIWRRIALTGEHRHMHCRGNVVSILSGDLSTAGEWVHLSTDGGETWKRTSMIPFEPAEAVAFWDARYGVVAGDDGGIATTANGGASWEQRLSGLVATFHDVEYVDSLTVLAAGDNARLYRSDDGGLSWTRIQDPGTTYQINAIDAHSGVAWLVDFDGKVMKSTDGGLNWSAMNVSDEELLDIDFLSANLGHAVGTMGLAYRTGNGGSSWTPVTTNTQTDINAISFHDGANLWYAGDEGVLFGPGIVPLHSGFYIDLDAVSFADGSFGMAVGPSCGILKTGDGGMTWRRLSVPNQASICLLGNLTSVWMMDASNAIIVGDDGEAWTTANGGNSWTERDSKTTLDLYDVAFADASTGMIVGDFGQIRISNDGGATWNAPIGGAGTSEVLTDVSFASPDVVMIIGENTTIRRSETGGTSWMPVGTGLSGITLYDIEMLDDSTAVIVAASGGNFGVLRTTDGGSSWNEISVSGRPLSVSFGSPTHGYLAGLTGDLFTTSDAGATWTSRPIPTSGSIRAVSAVGSNTVTVVGDDGIILRTTTGGR